MENTSVISILDILELAHSLRQEQLSIANERNSYIKLNEKLKESTSNTSQNAWICAQQRQNLNNLILSKPDSRPSSCCLKANRLENVKFVDAYNSSLKYQHLPQYIELLNFLHQSPQLLAQCLAVADDLPTLRIPNSNASKAEQMDSIVQVISAGIYGNSIHGKDVEMMLKLLEKLLYLLISAHESPSRMLRVNSSSFARLYHKFHESSLSAKLFLTAALHEPIMSVLIDDDFMLDTDPVKAMACMHPKEKLKRFGREDAPEFSEYVRKFHDETVNKLFTLALQFIKSLCRNWIIFPSTIRWLMQTMYKLLQQKNFDRKTINEILTDMVFGHFICPAIVSPDLYGISDAPISENARFNLIQIGQVLQMLALVRNREVDGKFVELFRRFDQNVVSLLMEQLLENSYEISEMGLSHQLPTLYNIGRNSILITHTELNLLIQFLRQTCENDGVSEENSLKLRQILENLPKPEIVIAEVVNGDVSPSKKSGMMSNLGKQTKNKIAKTMSLNVPATSALSLNGASYDDNDLGMSSSNSGSNRNSNDEFDRVLIIPLTSRHEDSMALMSEEEVLNMNSIGQEPDTGSGLTEKNVEELSRRNEESDNIGVNGGHRKEKHTRFSLNHDDVSIGNTSDNLEAVSEAPSNHSVASSLDLEENNDNDNLSDMVSANVSGRGTPNISGRDTPSSQVIDGGEVQQIPTPQMAKILNKTRSDIEDKFCKFEIKKLLEGDETISIISDTWSTDVLASDSENIESNDRNFSTPLIPTNVILPEHNFQLCGLNQRGNLDISETQSESAWSTDVLASDSEKMTEIDTDDNQSITARSDITDTPRDQEVPNRTPDSPFFAPRVPNIHFRPIDVSNLTPRTPESPFSIRSYDESPRLLELGLNRCSADDSGSRFHQRGQRNNYAGMNHEQGAVGGIGTNSRSNIYLNFTNNSPNYLATVQPRPIRQNSSESQASTQSEHDKYQRRKPKEFIEPSQSLSVFRVSDPNLENFTTHVQEPKIIKSSVNLINPFSSSLSNCSDVSDLLNLSMEGSNDASANANVKSLTMAHEDMNSSDLAVEHRRLSSEQRQANFDSRRNGMIDLLGNMTPEVMHSNGSCLIPISQGSLTDDVKTQQNAQKAASEQKAAELLEFDSVISKTELLKLNEANGGIALSGGKVNGSNSKSGKSTGAIPKSISFDSSADKVEKSNRNAGHRRSDVKSSAPVQSSTGIFSRIRQGIKNRRGNKARHSAEELMPVDLLNGLSQTEIFGMNGGPINFMDQPNGTMESSDDILAKYRRKPSSSSDAANSDSTGSNNSSSFKTQNSDNENRLSNIMLNPETDYFLNAKRKLRLVLSSSDCHACDVRNNNVSTISPLLTYLQIQLAQALNQQNLQQISYVSEVLRCLNSLDAAAHYKLVEDLQKDVLNRQSYLQYLIRLRQDLLSIIATINNFEMRLQNDRETCNKHLVMVCVRLFLEKREQMIYVFQQEFNEKLVVDEKLELMEEYMGTLMEDLSRDGILQDMADWQLIEARGCIERILLQRLYRQVMFPNDDVDISRDQVLHDHIRKLSRVITPSHSSLRIPQRYLNEAPWPFAQKQIAYISAYKTPKEKVQCIIKCIRSIMNLLSMASERVPSADDLIPVLIYVIIKANPPYLLSTIQYVECFIGKELAGEESYWWTQFEAAIAFIKSMEYNSE